MPSESEEEIRKAIEDVLEMYDIKLEPIPDEVSAEERKERDSDYSEIISKTQARLDELTQKAEEIMQKTGMTREEIEAYGSNPNNFTPEQWQLLENVREACEKYKRDARSRIGEQELAKAEKPLEKKRKKAKGRFAKKKQWIPL